MNTSDTQTPAGKRQIIEPTVAIAIGAAVCATVNLSTGLAVMIGLSMGSILDKQSTGKRRYLRAALLILAMIVVMNVVENWADFKAGIMAGYQAGFKAGS